MYGLLLENMSDYIITKYGAERWEEIRRLASVEQPSFSVHQVYPENLIPRLSNRAIEVLGVTEREFFEGMGVHFVGFVSQYGYDRVLSVLGRHMRDFLNGLDNLHEYLKFSYPRMRAPSFICENETRQGLTLHYRSKRRGFVYYTMGQIKEVARHFYRKEMGIEVVREELLVDTVHVTFQLTFDNRAFGLASLTMTREEKHLPVSASVLFEIFPFCVVFSSDMVVRSIGNSLMVILPDLVGNKITNWFDLVRPLVAFQFQKILNRTNNIFELVTVEPVLTGRPFDRNRHMLLSDESATDGSAEKNLRLKGQMIYMDDWRMMMYLGTPVMPDLSSLVSTGLYINDLPMHDFSRDLMLAGTQQSVELKLALDQEQHKSKKLEESMRRLDMEMRRTDELLYQMIPKAVADRLRNGENPIDTCQMFHSVSILFADVVTFTEICSRLSPMEVVSMLNGMYSIFDTLTERNRVYKVETIGDAYMVVSGAPEREDNHAEKVCDMALDMLDAIKGLKDPSTGSHLRIRVGVHSGAVVAGIVGLKMPRYCLFGDSVNTASRMESTSEAMRVHVSQPTRDLLPACYQLVERGEVQVKGKGSMKTYWLEGRLSAARAVLAAQEEEEREDFEDPLEADEDCSAKDLPRDLEDDRSVYSPVTFQEIAKRSLASSPKRQPGRSNSIGSVQLPQVLQPVLSAPPPRSPLPPDPKQAETLCSALGCSPSGRLVGVAVGSLAGAGLGLGPVDPTHQRPSWNPPLQITSPPTSPSSRGSSQRGSLGSLAQPGTLGAAGAGAPRRGSLSVQFTPAVVEEGAAEVFQWGHPSEGDPYGMKVRPGSRRASITSMMAVSAHGGRPTTPLPAAASATAAPAPAPSPPPSSPEAAPPPVPVEARALVHSGTQAGPGPAGPATANHATSPLMAAKGSSRRQAGVYHWNPLQAAQPAQAAQARERDRGDVLEWPPDLRCCPRPPPVSASPSASAESSRAASYSPDPRTPRAVALAAARSLEELDAVVAGAAARAELDAEGDGHRLDEPRQRRARQHQHRGRQGPGRPRQRMTRSQSHHQHFHQHHHHHHGCAPGASGTPASGLAPAPRHAAPPRRSKSTGCSVT